MHQVEIDVELARQRPHGWKHLQGPCRRRRRRFGCARSFLLLSKLANDGAGIASLTFGKFNERCADLDQIALAAEQARDLAAPRGGDLDHCFVGLDRHQRLIDHHAITLIDVPRDDFGLLEAFAQIRQQELAHGNFRRVQANSQALRVAATMRGTEGM